MKPENKTDVGLGGTNAKQRQGYYFEFKRGSWTQEYKNEGWCPAKHHEKSGIRYVGNLTECQMDSLDALINKFCSNLKVTHNAK